VLSKQYSTYAGVHNRTTDERHRLESTQLDHRSPMSDITRPNITSLNLIVCSLFDFSINGLNYSGLFLLRHDGLLCSSLALIAMSSLFIRRLFSAMSPLDSARARNIHLVWQYSSYRTRWWGSAFIVQWLLWRLNGIVAAATLHAAAATAAATLAADTTWRWWGWQQCIYLERCGCWCRKGVGRRSSVGTLWL